MSTDETPAPDPVIQDLSGPDSPHFSVPVENSAAAENAEPTAAWQQVGEGRFMPMRVRGSCHGRALG